MNRLMLRLGAVFLVAAGSAETALGQLDLVINVDTGDASIVSSDDMPVEITGYSVTSASGALLVGNFQALGTTPEFAGFEVANPTPNGISELNPSGSAAITSTALPLGTLIESVELPGAPFGQVLDTSSVTGDLGLDFLTLGGDIETGTVTVVGATIVNNLVLTIDATSGEATLTNASTTGIGLGGYTIGSDAGSFLPAGFTGFDDPNLDIANPTANNLSELSLPGGNGLFLSAGESVSLGVVFDTSAAAEGVSLNFLFSEGDAVPGDYNEDGVVDGADYTVFRDNFGSDSFTLPNETVTPGEVTAEDFQTLLDNFGSDVTDSPLTFESLAGIVVFESVPAAPSAALVAVPEPGTAALLLAGLTCGLAGRRASQSK